MKAPRARYLVAASGERRDGAGSGLDVPHDRVFSRAADLLPLAGRDPGVILLDPDTLLAEEVVEVVLACEGEGPGWIPALLLEGENGKVVTLALGYRMGLAELASACETEGQGVPISLVEVVERVRSARHDINNPLAAALAETQLLMMDAEGQDLREALDIIHDQLRRIQSMVASLKGLRRPPD